MKTKAKHKGWYHFIITGLPFIIYPFVFIASIMSLAGNPDSGISFISTVIALSFLWLSLLYPFAYGITLIGFLLSTTKKKKKVYYFLTRIYSALCGLIFFVDGNKCVS